MILRLTAVLAVVFGLTALLGYLQIVGKAPWSTPEMRHLRAMKDRASAPGRLAPFTDGDFASLPRDLPPESCGRFEARGVSFDGYVQRLVVAPDGDTHFELVSAPRRPGARDTAYVTAELTPQWRGESDRWAFEGLVASLRPNHGGATAWDSGPLRARVSGWLLYDFQHDVRHSPDALAHGARVAGWEIHPITRLELWRDSLGRFADLPQ